MSSRVGEGCGEGPPPEKINQIPSLSTEKRKAPAEDLCREALTDATAGDGGRLVNTGDVQSITGIGDAELYAPTPLDQPIPVMGGPKPPEHYCTLSRFSCEIWTLPTLLDE